MMVMRTILSMPSPSAKKMMTGVMVVHGSPTHNERPRPKGELSGADPPIAHASSTQHMETSAKGK